MSAVSHFDYRFLGLDASPPPCEPDGTIWRIRLPPGMPHRRVYWGVPTDTAYYYANFRMELRFWHHGELVLRLPKQTQDDVSGGGVLMHSPDVIVGGNALHLKWTQDAMACYMKDQQYCVPGFHLDIIADEVQWWYDLEFSPLFNSADGCALLAVISEAPYARN